MRLDHLFDGDRPICQHLRHVHVTTRSPLHPPIYETSSDGSFDPDFRPMSCMLGWKFESKVKQNSFPATSATFELSRANRITHVFKQKKRFNFPKQMSATQTNLLTQLTPCTRHHQTAHLIVLSLDIHNICSTHQESYYVYVLPITYYVLRLEVVQKRHKVSTQEQSPIH